MDQHQETLTGLTQAITQNPGDARALARRGETYRLLNRFLEALADFDQALALKPDYAWALAHRGETYRLLGCYEDALADFDYALQLRPEHAWTLAHRGASYRLTKCYGEALTYFDRAIELKPDYAWAIIHRGSIYMILKRYEEALAELDRAIALDEAIIGHWRGERGLILNALGRYTESIACCEQALQEDAEDYIALYSLAVAKTRRQGLVEAHGEIERTRVLLQAVLQGAVDQHARAGVLYRLGGLAALEGKSDEALTYFQQALPLDDEPGGIARHDPAWHDLRFVPPFQTLLAEITIEEQNCDKVIVKHFLNAEREV